MIKFVNFYSSKKGFTLLELSISITALLLIVLSISQSGQYLIQKITSKSKAHIFYHSLSDIRFKALATNQTQLLSGDTQDMGFNNIGIRSKSNTKTIGNHKITLGVGVYEDVVIK